MELVENTQTISFDGLRLRVQDALFSNKHLVRILNEISPVSFQRESYSIVNVHNPSLPVIFDRLEHRYYVRPGYEDHPATGVSWTGAQLVATLVGGRLPYEREWEYCATSGDPDKKYPWGEEEPSLDRANYNEFIGRTTPIRQYPPNPWGFYDMAGNAEEWCVDGYPGDDPSREMVLEHVVKGGSWNKGPEFLECSARRGKWYRVGTVGIGFRVVWQLPLRGDENVG